MNDDKKVIPVFSGSLIEVQKLRFELLDAGVNVLIRDDNRTATLSGFVNIMRPAMQLCILETEVEKAKPVVAAFKEEMGL